ncbi:conserved hypothetical protein [Sulfolobus islandicus L.S.2.15]|uniref:Uncharacterized protein n=1 Tax=Saccharolobus islandicus (strain L.S.2.15 / Lassen \|nr:hypothetical protein [Sulfolobus islandicus]ACP35708.1 conserved hypothetical protein [Sulfolobus islandicus L.S.2.15]
MSIINYEDLRKYVPEERLDKVKERLEILEAYDLSHITSNFIWKGRRFSPEQVWPLKIYYGRADREFAEKIEKEFRRFIALTLIFPKTLFTAPAPVDLYWHFLILHTKEYEKFSKSVWGIPRHGYVSLKKLLNNDDNSFRLRFNSKPSNVNEITILPKKVLESLDDSTLYRILMLERLDLSPISEGLLHSIDEFKVVPEQRYPLIAHFGKIDNEIVKRIELEFKKWMALNIAYSRKELYYAAPSGVVDMYFHLFILHTILYKQFCEMFFGRFIHHPLGELS